MACHQTCFVCTLFNSLPLIALSHFFTSTNYIRKSCAVTQRHLLQWLKHCSPPECQIKESDFAGFWFQSYTFSSWFPTENKFMGHVMCVLGWCLHLSYKPKNFQSWNTTCNNYIWQTLNLNVYTHTHMHILTFIFFYFAFHKKLKKK